MIGNLMPWRYHVAFWHFMVAWAAQFWKGDQLSWFILGCVWLTLAVGSAKRERARG